MYKGIKLSASLMCIDWLNAGKQLKELEQSKIEYLHIDVIDGRFAPDFCMGSSIIAPFIENSNMKLDYHLMVEEPSTVFDAFTKRKDDFFMIHQEACRNLHRDLMKLKKETPGLKVGVALSPGTNIDSLEYVIEDVDAIMLMTVNPGFKGQTFVPQTIRKIKNLQNMIKAMGLDITITVDGNVNARTIPEMVAAGADMLILGSSGLFLKDITIQEALKKIYDAIDEGLNRR